MPRELSTLEADFAARFAELLACKRGIEADVDEPVAAILRNCRLLVSPVIDGEQRVLGIYTDGDLRRTLEKRLDFSATPVSSVMSKQPRTIAPDKLAAEAVQLMDQYNISQMLVVDADNKLVGALNMHDLLHAKVI